MAATLVEKKCYNHFNREAVATCPSCKKFFCRECISDYDDRIICAPCIEQLQGKDKITKTKQRKGLGLAVATLLAYIVCFLSFFALGKIISSISHSFHDGTFLHEE